MGYFYFDESIHERASFILGAFVYSNADLSKPVADAIASVGLKPGTDEFKSSGRDADQDRRFALRHLLRMEMMDARLGVVLTSDSERGWLGDEAIRGLQWLINVNELGRGHEVYFDQGVSFSRRSVDVSQFERSTGSICHLEQDSRLVGGLQVADLAAHSLATMVLETMGLVSKQVPSGPYLGYNETDHPDPNVNIGFELWVSTRRSLFSRHVFTDKSFDSDEGMTADTASYALHVSERCPESVRHAAVSRLGKTYLGCIY